MGLNFRKEQRNPHSGQLNYILTFDASPYLATRFDCFPCGFFSGSVFCVLSDCQVRLCLQWNRDVVLRTRALTAEISGLKGTTVCGSSKLPEKILRHDVGSIHLLLPSPDQATHTEARAFGKTGLEIVYKDASAIWGKILLSFEVGISYWIALLLGCLAGAAKNWTMAQNNGAHADLCTLASRRPVQADVGQDYLYISTTCSAQRLGGLLKPLPQIVEQNQLSSGQKAFCF